jgi:hypothetical protein
MKQQPEWPQRGEIERRWRALVDGSMTREEVHEWTLPWVEPWAGGYEDGPWPDMTYGALQNLHGFDSAYMPETPNLIHHGQPGTYDKSREDIQRELDAWLSACNRYDHDPEAYRAEQSASAEAAIASERERGRRGLGRP